MSRADALLDIRPKVVFGLSAVEAAEAIGMGVTLFRRMVDDGRMPRPRCADGRRIWDVDEVRAKFKALPHDGGEIEPADAGDQWGAVKT